MATSRLHSGQTVALLAPAAQTHTLVRSEHLEVALLALPAGRHIASHQVAGELTLQCLHGEVEVVLTDKTVKLHSSELLFLAAAEPHGLHAPQQCQLLLTLVRYPAGSAP